ncbi:MAG TPA: copper resistance protein CopC, partial [Roseovarius sp.]|nr:copper resistance protein CopC [Roseovarius sp.]
MASATAGPVLARITLFAAGATILLGGLLIGVQGLDMLSLAPGALFTMQPWQAGISAPISLTVVLTAGAAGLAAVSLRSGGTSVRKVLALG